MSNTRHHAARRIPPIPKYTEECAGRTLVVGVIILILSPLRTKTNLLGPPLNRNATATSATPPFGSKHCGDHPPAFSATFVLTYHPPYFRALFLSASSSDAPLVRVFVLIHTNHVEPEHMLLSRFVFFRGWVSQLLASYGRACIAYNICRPSYVAWDSSTGERLIGDAAKNQASTNPENTVFDIKRLIGRQFDDKSVQADSKLFPFNVVSKDKQAAVQVIKRG